MKRFMSITAVLAGFAVLPSAWALPVNGTGFLTSNVIMGSGIENGAFAGDTFQQYEVALRGKERYTSNYGYDGDSTYTFAEGTDINLDWSVNSNICVPGPNILCALTPVSSVVWSLIIPTLTPFDPINDILAVSAPADHSFGTNTTPQSGGAEAVDTSTYNALRSNNNVAQNSINLGILPVGIYSFTLEKSTPILCVTTPCPQWNPSVSVDIVVNRVPSPGTLPSVAAGLFLLGLIRRRARV